MPAFIPKTFGEFKAYAEKKRGDTCGVNIECHIVLGGGGLRSSKDIYFGRDECEPWEVFHNIDGELISYSDEEIKASNIGKAIESGCLVIDED
jgi:hypothetical protein